MSEGVCAAAVVRRRAGSRRRVARAVAAAVATTAALRTASATTYAWDANGAAAGTGGAGTWDLTSPLWTTDGGASYTNWSNGAANLATFGGTGGTVTLAAPIVANGLTFAAAGYGLTNAGSGSLTLAGTNPTVNTGGYDVTFAVGVNKLTAANGSTLFKAGVGQLSILNDQNGDGTNGIGTNVTWNISGGSLTAAGTYNSSVGFYTARVFGNATGSVVTLNAGSLVFLGNAGAGYAAARTVNVTPLGGAVSDGGYLPGVPGGGSTISPTFNVSAGNGLNLVSAGVLDLDAGVIQGAGGVTVYGTGQTRLLSNANTYTGGTTVTPGAYLLVGGTKSLGTGNLTLNGGTVNVNAVVLPVQRLTSAGGTVAFNASGGGSVAAASAAVSGTTRVSLFSTTVVAIPTASTYTAVTSTGGGLAGSYAGAFLIPGGQNLTVPISGVLQTVNGTVQRTTATAAANAGGTAVTLTTATAAATGRAINVMPLGSSITAGTSAQTTYDGGGYRSQLYQTLVNDGRFVPTFVGSSTTTQANNPAGPDLMTVVGQPRHEGHPGYTTAQVLANLNGNDNSGGNNGGFWLAPGNGVNPDYVTVNIGANDYAYNNGDTGAPDRLNQILTQVAALRPNATVIVSTLLYRNNAGDGTAAASFEARYNPALPGIVYQHVLAGQHVQIVDGYDAVTPNNSLALIGPDLIHPTQAGYDAYANAWAAAVTTGAAFYTGAGGSSLTTTANGRTNWAQDFARTTDAAVNPAAGTDAYFNGGGTGGTLPLGADLSVRGLNFTAGATAAVTLAGPNTLTIGAGGITVQAGTAAHAITAPLTLAAAQTWANAAANRFTVGGPVGGAGPLTLGGTGLAVIAGNAAFTNAAATGTGTVVLSGSNTYTGGTTVAGGTLVAANSTGSATGPGPVAVAAAATLAGTGAVAGTVTVAGTITGGAGAATTDAVGTLTTGPQAWPAGGAFVANLDAADVNADRLVMSGLTVSATKASPFVINVVGDAATAAAGRFTIATDTGATGGPTTDPFALASLKLLVNGTAAPAAFTLAEQADPGPLGGVDLVLVAAPEPASLALLSAAAVPLLAGRSRRRPATPVPLAA